VAIYLHYDGIKGNVTAKGYQGHIDILSFGYKIKRKISMEVGNLTNRESSNLQISTITLLKNLDNSVTGFFKEAVTGAAGKTAIIKFARTGSDKVQEYMDYTLENCLVSHYSSTASIYGKPSEVIILSFSKIIVNYTDYDATNKSGNPQRVGYDLATAKSL